MSLRELKALGVTVSEKSDSKTTSKRATRSTRNAMAEERVKQLEQELAAAKLENERKNQRLAEMQAANEEKDRQLGEMRAANDRARIEKDRELAAVKTQCADKERELEDATARIENLTTECDHRIEETTLRFELDKLRAIEKLRDEHVLELKSERQQLKEEKIRADTWINDLKAHFSVERDRLLEQIRALEDEVKLKADSAGSTTPATATTVSTTSTVTPSSATPATVATTTAASSGETIATTAGETIATTAGGTIATTAGGPAVVCTATCESTSPSTSAGHPDSISTTAGGGAATITTSSVSTITTPVVTGSTTDKTGDLHVLFNEFIEAQKQVMVQAAAAQSFPTLPKFSGEGNQDDDDSFSCWHESFEERALLTGWTPEQKLCKLKAHLE